METTNTTGVIAKAAEAKNTPAKVQHKNPMAALLDNEITKKTLQDALKENAGSYAASILDLYNSDTYLKQCEPKKVFGECLKAVSLKLPINKQLGFAYVIAYKGVPQFQIGYKGLIQLCMRTGAYKHINADKVYKGEFKGIDKLTGTIDLSGERTSDEIVGYFAYIETLNGFSHCLYKTKDEVTEHAKRYSKAFTTGAWKTNFDEMAIKTVLRLLLSHYGYMSVEMMSAFSAEETSGAAVSTADEQPQDVIYTDSTEISSVDKTTGEVIEPEESGDYPFAEA